MILHSRAKRSARSLKASLKISIEYWPEAAGISSPPLLGNRQSIVEYIFATLSAKFPRKQTTASPEEQGRQSLARPKSCTQYQLRLLPPSVALWKLGRKSLSIHKTAEISCQDCTSCRRPTQFRISDTVFKTHKNNDVGGSVRHFIPKITVLACLRGFAGVSVGYVLERHRPGEVQQSTGCSQFHFLGKSPTEAGTVRASTTYMLITECSADQPQQEPPKIFLPGRQTKLLLWLTNTVRSVTFLSIYSA